MRLFTSVDGRNERLEGCLSITSQQLLHATRHYQQRTCEVESQSQFVHARQLWLGLLKYEAV